MKKIIKSIVLVTLLAPFSSCVNDTDPIATAKGFELRKDATVVSPATLTELTDTDIYAEFIWDEAKYSIETQSSYKLVINDALNDPQRLKPVYYDGPGLSITPEIRNGSITVKEMNTMMNKLPSFKCGEMNIDVRIESTLGENINNSIIQYSNPVNVKVTAYSLKPQILSFVKSSEIATANSSAKLESSVRTSISDFEGYVYLTAGNYNFVRPDACQDYTNPTVLGGTGTLMAGVIDTSATPASISIPVDGHYLVKANLVTNTFSISEFTSIGVFGRATRAGAFGFNNVVPMTYDNATKKWTLTMDLLKGQGLKFRALKWSGVLIVPSATAAFPKPDYIPSGSTTVSTFGTPAANVLSDTSTTDIKSLGNASLTETDKYLVEVDVSNPRKYTYKLTKI